MLPVKEFATAAELRAHYRAVDARVLAAAIRVEPPAPIPVKIVPIRKSRGGKLARKPSPLVTTTLDRIIAEECCRFAVLRADILNPPPDKTEENKPRGRARWVVAYRGQTELGYSLTALGNKLDMDRTSVAHGAAYIDQLLRP